MPLGPERDSLRRLTIAGSAPSARRAAVPIRLPTRQSSCLPLKRAYHFAYSLHTPLLRPARDPRDGGLVGQGIDEARTPNLHGGGAGQQVLDCILPATDASAADHR